MGQEGKDRGGVADESKFSFWIGVFSNISEHLY